ncbi:MAG: GxxExxY protein [Gemmatimonadetes bacterium]|nr:GxxExxY protein [Gemmatimonadota bacterium]
MRDIDEITGLIIDEALQIHRRLGPGLFESVYEAILARELERRGLPVQRQVPVRLEYDGLTFDEAFRADLIVAERVVIELKSLDSLAPVHAKQLLTYLKLLHLPVGLLINFGSDKLMDGVRRIVNHHVPTSTSPLRINQVG